MAEITISIEQYNLLYGKALAFDNIVDAIERNIDQNEIYPVNEKEILLLTGANHYRDEHFRRLANKAKEKLGKYAPEYVPAEETVNHAEDQTEL